MKYYAVIEGRGEVPNIYESWDECKQKISGFSNAKYKSFKDLKKAFEYVLKEENENYDAILKKYPSFNNFLKQTNIDNSKTPKSNSEANFSYQAYVDGSFNPRANNYGYGAVILRNNDIIKEISGRGENEKAIKMRQVYGELKAVMEVLNFCVEESISEIEILYDYTGIENWAKGLWKRNNEFTQLYHSFVKEKMKKIKIKFTKVKAHSNNKFNDIADELAKRAINLQER